VRFEKAVYLQALEIEGLGEFMLSELVLSVPLDEGGFLGGLIEVA
jgi:hypothetical protein